MTFQQQLINSGYYFQPECGVFENVDRNGNSHSYLEEDDNIWSYEKYNKDGEFVTSKVFTPGC